MRIFSNLFKNPSLTTTAHESSVNHSVDLMESHFVRVGNLFRNRDGSIPTLSQFIDLNLTTDDFVQFVHGKTQADLQNRLAFKSKVRCGNKKRAMENRLRLKAQKSRNKSKRINGLQNEFYDFGMFAPFGVYHAANTFGLYTLDMFTQSQGNMLGQVMQNLGSLDPSLVLIEDTPIGGLIAEASSFSDDLAKFDF